MGGVGLSCSSGARRVVAPYMCASGGPRTMKGDRAHHVPSVGDEREKEPGKEDGPAVEMEAVLEHVIVGVHWTNGRPRRLGLRRASCCTDRLGVV
jgi:hypothetical protein